MLICNCSEPCRNAGYSCEHIIHSGACILMLRYNVCNCACHCRFQKKEVRHHECYDRGETWQKRAILVSLGLVYYFRLNNEFREEYKKHMEEICTDITFTNALDDEVYIHISLLLQLVTHYSVI